MAFGEIGQDDRIPQQRRRIISVVAVHINYDNVQMKEIIDEQHHNRINNNKTSMISDTRLPTAIWSS